MLSPSMPSSTKNLRNRKRMADVRLAAAAALFAVGFFGQRIGAVDHSKVVGPPAVNQALFEVITGNGHFTSGTFVFSIIHSPL